jgi:hypothetical protein
MDKEVVDFVFWFDPRYFVWVKRRPNCEGNLIAHVTSHHGISMGDKAILI